MALNPETVALELDRAAAEAKPIELLTVRYPSLTWEDARAIARATDRLRSERGQRMIGYKLGWTSAQMREALGIERPNWGTLWADQVLDDGRLDHGRRIHPKVEPELVFRAGRDFEHPVTTADVHASGEWALGLEVVDPRYPSYNFDWLDNTADNSSSGAVVIGTFRTLSIAPSDVTVTFDDGSDHRHGVGANAMDDPGAAVAWLIDALAAEGEGLAAGSIVFTGGLTAPFDVTPGGRFSLQSPDLDPVVLTA